MDEDDVLVEERVEDESVEDEDEDKGAWVVPTSSVKIKGGESTKVLCGLGILECGDKVDADAGGCCFGM